MQSDFCMRIGSTCFVFLYRVTQNSFSPKEGGFSFWAPATTHTWQNPSLALGRCTPGVFSYPQGLGLAGKEKHFVVPSSGQLFLGKLPPSLGPPSLHNAIILKTTHSTRIIKSNTPVTPRSSLMPPNPIMTSTCSLPQRSYQLGESIWMGKGCEPKKMLKV